MRIWDRLLAAGPYLELVNKILQILALLVGAIWAYWTWQQLSAPSLQTTVKLSVETNTEWSDADDACIGSLSATIENIGMKNVNVTKVELELVTANPVKLAQNEQFKIIPVLPAQTSRVYIGELNTFLEAVYAPKDASNESVAFLYRPLLDTELWYRVEAFDEKSNPIADRYGMFDSCSKK